MVKIATGEKCLKKNPCDDHYGTVLRLSPGYFFELSPIVQPSRAWEMSRTMGENAWDGHAPILVELNVDGKAPAGDYEIRLALTYASGDDVDVAKDAVTVHVTSWSERHRLEIILGIIGTGIGILALLRS
jgi:hypothetical protein